MKKKLIQTVAALMAVILSLGLFTGCGSKEMATYRPVENVNELDGRRVGVIIGTAADYMLSPRDDMQLYRYDDASGMIMALCYKKIDCIATDVLTAGTILSLTTGIDRLEEPFGQDGFVFESKNNPELTKNLDEFILEYRETEEYAKWAERVRNYDGTYEWPDLELTGTGEKIVACTYAENFPGSFRTVYGETQGFETEIIYAFANKYNYQLEVRATSETDMYQGIMAGMYDVIFGHISTLYRDDCIQAGVEMSESFFDDDILVIQISDPDNLGVTGEIE